MKTKLIIMILTVSVCSLLFGFASSAQSDDYTVSDEALTIIDERIASAVAEGSNYVELSDLDIVVRMYADSFSSEYEEILRLVAQSSADYGLIRYGDYYEQYFYCSLDTSPLPTADIYGIGDNRLDSISIIYNDYYLNPDGKTCNTELVERDKKAVAEAFDAIVSCVDESMSDIEKALRIHDYLVLLNNYPDPIGTDEDGNLIYENKAYTGIGLLADKNAVCISYAKIYACALETVGIRAITVSSDDMLHEWNMVEIDGEWYHVDVTWDDPRYENGITKQWIYNEDNWDIGAIEYTYFLLSDEKIEALDHYNWAVSQTFEQDYFDYYEAAPVSGESGTFNGYFFRENGILEPITSFAYSDGYWYFFDISDYKFKRIKCEPNAAAETIETGDLFEYDCPKYIGEYNGSIYLCGNTALFRYDPQENIIETVLSTDENASFSEMAIIGSELEIIELRYVYDGDSEIITSESKKYDMAVIEQSGDFKVTPEASVSTTQQTVQTTEATTTSAVTTSVSDSDNESIYREYNSNLTIYAVSAGLVIIAVVVIFAAVMKKKNGK